MLAFATQKRTSMCIPYLRGSCTVPGTYRYAYVEKILCEALTVCGGLVQKVNVHPTFGGISTRQPITLPPITYERTSTCIHPGMNVKNVTTPALPSFGRSKTWLASSNAPMIHVFISRVLHKWKKETPISIHK